MTNPLHDELREQVHDLLDLFFEPSDQEKYVKDLEDDIVALINDKVAEELENIQATFNPTDSDEVVNHKALIESRRIVKRLAELKEKL